MMRVRIKKDNSIHIPIYLIGKHQDMDEVYSLCRENQIVGSDELIMSEGKWEIAYVKGE